MDRLQSTPQKPGSQWQNPAKKVPGVHTQRTKNSSAASIIVSRGSQGRCSFRAARAPLIQVPLSLQLLKQLTEMEVSHSGPCGPHGVRRRQKSVPWTAVVGVRHRARGIESDSLRNLFPSQILVPRVVSPVRVHAIKCIIPAPSPTSTEGTSVSAHADERCGQPTHRPALKARALRTIIAPAVQAARRTKDKGAPC